MIALPQLDARDVLDTAHLQQKVKYRCLLQMMIKVL